jgi:hypothetical protein
MEPKVLIGIVMKSSIFRDITLYFPTVFTLVSCLDYSLILRMEVTSSSETSVEVQFTRRCYMPDNGTIQKILMFSVSRLFLFSPWR